MDMIPLSDIYGDRDDFGIPQALALGIEVEDIVTGKAFMLVYSDTGCIQLLERGTARVFAKVVRVDAGHRLTRDEALRILDPPDLAKWRATGRYLLADGQPWKRVLVSDFLDYRAPLDKTSVGTGAVLCSPGGTRVVLMQHSGEQGPLVVAMHIATYEPWGMSVAPSDPSALTVAELGQLLTAGPSFPGWFYLDQLADLI